MEKRRNALGWMILILLSLLLAGQVFSGFARREPDTVTARRYPGPEPVWVRGVVIRQETPLRAPANWRPAVPDGTRVAAGQTLWALAAPGIEAGDIPSALPARRARLREVLGELGGADSRDRPCLARELTALLLAECGTALPAEQAETGKAGPGVTAPASGVFAAVSDGLESLLTPEEPWTPLPLPPDPVRAGTSGRLITGDRWYLRIRAGDLPEGMKTGDVLDAGLSGQTLQLRLEAQRGELALLSCDSGLEAVADRRQISVKFLPKIELGVEIPAETVYTVGEQRGVWCLVGDAAVFKPVTVLHDLGDTLVVAWDQSTTAALWPGDEVYWKEPD